MLVIALFAGGLAFLVFSGQQSTEPTDENFVIALLFLATAIVQLWINQPTDVFAYLPHPPRFRDHALAAGGDEAAAGGLQQRPLPHPETGNGRFDHALRFRPAGAERFARTEPRPLRCRFRQPFQQRPFRRNRCAFACHQPDQRLHRGVANSAGPPPQQVGPRRLRGWPCHLVVIPRLRPDRPNQSFLVRRK